MACVGLQRVIHLILLLVNIWEEYESYQSFRLSNIKIRGATYFKLAFIYSLVPRQHPKVCSINSLWAVCRSIASQSLLQIGLTAIQLVDIIHSFNECSWWFSTSLLLYFASASLASHIKNIFNRKNITPLWSGV